MKRLSGILACLSLGVAIAAAAHEMDSDFEASMVVTGTLTVNPDGSVEGYALYRPDKLPAIAVNAIKATVPNWKFQPVLEGGKPVMAKTQMSLRIVAHPIDAQHATIRVSGAQFGRDAMQAKGSPECANDACLTTKKLEPPAYPISAIRDRASGTVYLFIEVDRRGRVAKSAVRQVSLTHRYNDTVQIRKTLAAAALSAASRWTFNIPTSGEEATRDHWVVQVPVNFSMEGDIPYGGWSNYIPGPVQDVPWAHDGDPRTAASGSADALPGNNAAFVADPRFVLLTPFADDNPATPQQGSGSGS